MQIQQKVVERSWSTRRVVLVGLFLALNMVATYVHIPIGPSMMHLGTTTLFITALFLSPKDAAIAAGGGMFLFDIFGGFLAYAPFTLVIKGVMAFVVAKIAQMKGMNGYNLKQNCLAYLVGGLISLVGYYLTNAYFTSSFIVPIAKIPGSLMTTSVGILIALPIGIKAKQALEKVFPARNKILSH